MKNLLSKFITIILSLTFILIGYNVTTSGRNFNFNTDNNIVYKAKVLEIVDINEDIIDLGYDQILNKTIFFNAEIKNNDKKNEVVEVHQSMSEFFAVQPPEVSKGDEILISFDVNVETGEYYSDKFVMLEYSRTSQLIWVLVIFFVCLLIFGRSKGLYTLLSLVFTCASIFMVLIPGILAGFNIYLLTFIICTFIIATTLVLVNGLNFKSISAGIGCFGGVVASGLITLLLNNSLKLTGLLDDQSVLLLNLNPDSPIDLKAIVFSAVIIGAVGAIMDVAISIASSLNELCELNPEISSRKLLKSGITIGQDILGTMTNTLVLAYIGGSLSMVLLLLSNSSSLVYLANTEMIVVELVQALVGSLGILLTLPLTSMASAIMLTKIQGKNKWKL